MVKIKIQSVSDLSEKTVVINPVQVALVKAYEAPLRDGEPSTANAHKNLKTVIELSNGSSVVSTQSVEEIHTLLGVEKDVLLEG